MCGGFSFILYIKSQCINMLADKEAHRHIFHLVSCISTHMMVEEENYNFFLHKHSKQSYEECIAGYINFPYATFEKVMAYTQNNHN